MSENLPMTRRQVCWMAAMVMSWAIPVSGRTRERAGTGSFSQITVDSSSVRADMDRVHADQ
jgi:hypothetical protein